MKKDFEKDLARWECGELSLSILKSRYPDRDVDGVVRVFSLLKTVASEPVPDQTRCWNMVRARMAPRGARSLGPVPLLQRFRPGLQRRLAFGLAAAVLAVPPVALAANSPEVRDSVSNFVATTILNLDEAPEPAAPAPTQQSSSDSAQQTNLLPTPSKGDGGSIGELKGGAGGGNAPAPVPSVVAGQQGASGAGAQQTSGADGANAVSGQAGTGGTGADGADAPAEPVVETPAPPPSPEITSPEAP